MAEKTMLCCTGCQASYQGDPDATMWLCPPCDRYDPAPWLNKPKTGEK